MCSKVGPTTALPLPPATASTSTSTAASALLSTSLPLPSTAAAGSSPLTSLQLHAEPFGSWSAAAAAAAAAQFVGGAASGASFAARANAVWGFWGWQCRTGHDRLLIQCRVCKASCLKVVQFSAPATCRFELLRVRVRVRGLCRWSLRCSLAFHSALCKLLISLQPPLIRSPRITVLAAVCMILQYHTLFWLVPW